jgi:hypothetical protein
MRRLLLVFGLFAVGCGPAEPEPEPEPDRFEGYGEPIVAPEREWTQIDFAEAHCGNGSEVGIMFNPSSDSTKVLFYLEGGGACWDNFTCSQSTATFVRSGIGEASIEAFLTDFGQRGIFNRENTNNPFRDFSFVYVPYCTGDIHSGTNAETGHNVEHVGYNNIGHYLHRVVPSFPDATEVFLAGISAGGFGVTFNYEQVRQAFIDLPVHALIDSAPPMSESVYSSDLAAIQDAQWQLSSHLPDFCFEGETNNCNGIYDRFFLQAETYPDARFAIVTSTGDETLRFFFGLGTFPPAALSISEYQAGVSEILGESINHPNVNMWVQTGTKHTYMYDEPVGLSATGGVTLIDWLHAFVDDEGLTTVFPQ